MDSFYNESEINDEALIGLGLLYELHMQGQHDQKSHGNEGGGINSLSSLSKTIDVSDSPKPIGAIKDLIVYRVGSTSEKEVYFGDNIEQVAPYASFHEGHEIKRYKVSADNVLAAKNHGQLFRELFNKSWGEEIANLDVRLKLNDSKEAWRRLQSRMMNKVRSMGYDAVIFTFPESKGMQEFVYIGKKNKDKNIVSEFHLPGKHDQESHGNETKSVKAKKKEIKKTIVKPIAGIVKVGEQIYADDQPVYKVHSDGDKMFKDNIFSDEGLVLVGLRGKHKGVVLYSRPITSHQDMLYGFDAESSDIDWAHFYIEHDENAGKERLFIDTYYAGYDTMGLNPVEVNTPEYFERALDNIHIAKKALVRVGVKPDRMVSILEPTNEFGNRSHWDVTLAELGAGVFTLALDENAPEFLEFSDEHSTDAMICFKIPDAIRDELKEKYPFIQDIDNLHITLVYLGDTRTLDAGSVIEALTNWSAYQAPIKGKLQGIARFVNDEETDPIVMTFDSKQMPEVYDVLVDFLYAEKIEFHKEHGFIPHMTLAYIPKDEDMPVQTIEPIEINFTSVWLVWNGEWLEIELSGVLNRLEMFTDKLTELGAGFLGLLGIELHGGEVHMNGTTQEVHGKKGSRKKTGLENVKPKKFTTEQLIADFERRIKNLEYERACIFKDGKILFARDGDKDSVHFSPTDVQKMKSAILSHNHPTSGATFSMDDYDMFMYAELKEIRAVGNEWTYILTAPDGFDYKANARELRLGIASAQSKIKETGLKTDDWKINNHLVSTEWAKSVGLTYKRIKTGD